MSAPVLYVARFVPSYRQPVLERLNTRLHGRLVVCAGQPPATSSFTALTSDPATSYRQVSLRNYWLGGERVHAQPFGSALELNPAVVLAEESPRSLTLPLLLRDAKRRGAGTLLWGHFSSNNRTLSRWHPLDRYRIALARNADGCVCYTDQIAAMLRQHVPHQRLFVARNTLDTDILFALYDALLKEGRSAVRNRLGIDETIPTLAFIGRLVTAKGAHQLLDTYKALHSRGRVALLIIGAGPEENAMRARCKRENWSEVRFLGPLTALEVSAPYLFAADVLVSPGYMGLSICHAFALGLPVVTQTSPKAHVRYHSPEITYIQEGENGLLSPYGDAEGLVQAVRVILANQKHFSEKAISYAREHLQIEGMVDGLEQAIRFAERISTANPRVGVPPSGDG